MTAHPSPHAADDSPHEATKVNPIESAKAAGLRYVNDTRPGVTRERVNDDWRYLDAHGKPITDEANLERIKKIGIPPAWTEVWISPHANGHIQATGRDVKGRKQYRYHTRWRETRDETKYTHTIAFGEALPLIRARVEHDMKLPGMPREKVIATVVRLLETTLIRVGNQEYAKENHSFGLTTMRDRHVTVEGATIRFTFRGKSGVDHTITLKDRRLAQVVKRCRDIPGYQLFQYIDHDGAHQTIDSGDVNAYLHETTGQDFTAKDFRTWAGTTLAAMALQEFEAFDSDAQGRKNIVRAIESVSERLGNTPSICRKCYVHPAVLDSYIDGSLAETLRQRAEQELTESLHDLHPEEAAVLALLRQRLAHVQAQA